MFRIILFIFYILLINTQPIFAQMQSVQVKANLALYSENFLGVKNGIRYSNNAITALDLKYDLKNLSSQFSLNVNGDENFTFDRSYIQHTSGIITFGLGSINRHWSFSNNTSLILSHNARPVKSIYLKLEEKFKYDWLPPEANWSFEVFNGKNGGTSNNSDSMIAGMRAILTPFEGLNFELIQTSQWGGAGSDTGLSALGSALILDTNDGKNSSINKMAGFGISYKIPIKILPFRVYGQAIGEDEAGSLPSCLAYLAGLEWTDTKTKYPTIFGIEAVDTRIDTTSHGNCGPNTMYNNKTYEYTNNGKVIGAEIDTEGTSLSLFVRSKVSERINIEFVTKSVVINDFNWSNHRLSSKREAGLINSLSGNWEKSNIKLNGNIYYHGFNLDKAGIRKSYGIGFSSTVSF
jgi:hypothetical protein